MRNNKKTTMVLAYLICELSKKMQKRLPQSFGSLKTPALADIGVMAAGCLAFRTKREQLKWFELGAGMSLAKDVLGIDFMPFAQVVLYLDR
ncbi:MAG: hypothetical protein HXS40_03095 [Theionarchaea archaeon]|nr:hypothetical protein [Theionarchaea archaeon]